MESDVVKIALIVGSTRPNRFADVPAGWIVDAAAARDDLALEVLDLRDWPMLVAVELRMAPIKYAVHIGMEPFVGILFQGKTLDDYDHLVKARTAMFDELVWWARALRTAREATAEVDSIAA